MEQHEIVQVLNSRHFIENYEPPHENILLSIENKNIGSAGNFVIISGLPKAGKSTFLNAFISSNFKKEEIFGIELITENKIGYFDTESNQTDFYNNLKRIKYMAKIKNFPKNFNAYNTRIDSTETNKILIEAYILVHQPKIVFVDGLLDLLNNYNDEKESRELIVWLKKITSEYNILIIGVVHTGKKDNHTLGHFGSMVDRYAQSVLEVVKDKENNIFTLKSKYLRSANDFSDINIMYDENTNKYMQVSVTLPPPLAQKKRTK
jgi:archaellum biogenesis ATPase FlaH